MRTGLQGLGVPGWTQIAPYGHWLGPGNTNHGPAGYVPGILPLPVPPSYRTPGTPTDDLSQRMHHSTGPVTLRTCTYDRFSVTVGDPRGR